MDAGQRHSVGTPRTSPRRSRKSSENGNRDVLGERRGDIVPKEGHDDSRISEIVPKTKTPIPKGRKDSSKGLSNIIFLFLYTSLFIALIHL